MCRHRVSHASRMLPILIILIGSITFRTAVADLFSFNTYSGMMNAEVDLGGGGMDSEFSTNAPSVLAAVGNLQSAGGRAFGFADELTIRGSSQFATPGGDVDGGSRADSLATLTGDVSLEPNILGLPQRLLAQFNLPPGLLEIVNSVEPAPFFGDVRAGISAEFEFANSIRFSFEAELLLELKRSPTGIQFFEYSFPVLTAMGGMTDTAPLLNPTVIADIGSTTTVTANFPQFAGMIDLGVQNPLELYSFKYRIVTFVEGGGADGTSAIAAINDPLIFTSPMLSFSTASVIPEPGTLLLSLLGTSTLVGYFLRRRIRHLG